MSKPSGICYYAKKAQEGTSMCHMCRPLMKETQRKFFPKLGENKVTLNSGKWISITCDGMMFNLTELYRINYKPFTLSNIALRSFILTPIFRGIVAVLRKENDRSLSLIKKDVGPEICEHHADTYLHIGFLGLAMIDLRILIETDVSIWLFHQEIRNLVSTQVAFHYNSKKRIIFPVEELERIASYSEILEYSKIADNIISTTDGGNPTPWISIDCNPMVKDNVTILNGSLHVVYTTIDIMLAKRFNLLPHCKALGIQEDCNTKLSPIKTFPWSPTMEGHISQVIESAA